MNQKSRVFRKLLIKILLPLGVGFGCVLGAGAQSYPDKPVRIVVPYPAGAVADVMMRIIGQRLTVRFGQQFTIDNRPGGGGMAATKAVADAVPDGYTLLFNGPNHVTNLGLYKNVPYDPIADFIPITHVASSQVILVANAATGFTNIGQIVAAAKANPTGLNYASSGAGTGTHLSMEMLMRATGVKFTHIAYKGASPAAVALGGGEVQLGFSSVPLVQPLIETGRVVPILVGGSKRLAAFPSVPSLAELGMLNYDVDIWFGLLAPKSTPAAVVDTLGTEIRRILAEPAMVERFDKFGFTAIGSMPADFENLIKKDAQRWPQLIRELGIEGG